MREREHSQGSQGGDPDASSISLSLLSLKKGGTKQLEERERERERERGSRSWEGPFFTPLSLSCGHRWNGIVRSVRTLKGPCSTAGIHVCPCVQG